ncbi:response regulator transcription factor [Anaerovorax odorimutans]|uniref:Stage 0 sporulation protein A homolog n=1 Tax=Anaerovorax odorimutans TaxID=109327 RepID=A0ABT1RPG9_9FIRM|nr:response regulator transcription factor [Anaerovorax odorimutans]MCQ4637093.1 response regulator transcription factor [Anaerovorax odorimutans]
MERILIVEDEEKIREELRTALEKKGYTCTLIEEFEDAAGQIVREAPDLVLLDLNLPVQDGFYICQEVRKQLDVPIIVVTSSSSDMDELMSLNLGADDYITKPFNMHILLAHISTVLHRAYGRKATVTLTHKGLTLDVLKGRISYQGRETDLTKNELGILRMLMENAGQIISRTDLICHLWEMEEFVEDSTLTVNINRLRRKLADIGLEDYLLTKRGLGYMV